MRKFYPISDSFFCKLNFALICAFFLASGCHNTSNKDIASPNKEVYKNLYNIEIIYNKPNDSQRKGWSDNTFPVDSLYLTSEFYFESDSGSVAIPDSLLLSIWINNKSYSNIWYTKRDLYEQGHSCINCGLLKNIKDMGIRINNGNLAYVEIDSINHIVRAKYNGVTKRLKIDFLKSMPFYR